MPGSFVLRTSQPVSIDQAGHRQTVLRTYNSQQEEFSLTHTHTDIFTNVMEDKASTGQPAVEGKWV